MSRLFGKRSTLSQWADAKPPDCPIHGSTLMRRLGTFGTLYECHVWVGKQCGKVVDQRTGKPPRMRG